MKILIAEDDLTSRIVLTAMLKKQNYTLRLAEKAGKIYMSSETLS